MSGPGKSSSSSPATTGPKVGGTGVLDSLKEKNVSRESWAIDPYRGATVAATPKGGSPRGLPRQNYVVCYRTSTVGRTATDR